MDMTKFEAARLEIANEIRAADGETATCVESIAAAVSRLAQMENKYKTAFQALVAAADENPKLDGVLAVFLGLKVEWQAKLTTAQTMKGALDAV